MIEHPEPDRPTPMRCVSRGLHLLRPGAHCPSNLDETGCCGAIYGIPIAMYFGHAGGAHDVYLLGLFMLVSSGKSGEFMMNFYPPAHTSQRQRSPTSPTQRLRSKPAHTGWTPPAGGLKQRACALTFNAEQDAKPAQARRRAGLRSRLDAERAHRLDAEAVLSAHLPDIIDGHGKHDRVRAR